MTFSTKENRSSVFVPPRPWASRRISKRAWVLFSIWYLKYFSPSFRKNGTKSTKVAVLFRGTGSFAFWEVERKKEKKERKKKRKEKKKKMRVKKKRRKGEMK